MSDETSDDEAERIREERERWEEETLQPTLDSHGERRDEFVTTSSREVDRLYTPADLEDWDYEEDLGFPGEYPFTRGVHPTMHRGRLWTMRQFAGFGTPEETRDRFHYLIDQGQTGLSVAFDFPTLQGFDSDHAYSQGEVGKVGVAVDSLHDMETIFEGIPLDEVSTSMTINGPAPMIWAMFLAAAENQGADISTVRGTIQNDILKEYQAQKMFIFPPEPSVELVLDTFEWNAENTPKFNPISISGYHIREAGATAVQELAFTLANGMTYVRKAVNERGMDPDTFAPRLSFFFNSHNDLFEEVAKFRAARRIWADFMKNEIGAEDKRSWWLRFHTQTAGVSCTAQQPENNIVRTTIQALAAVLGGTQSLHTNSYDEALALPSEKAVRIALRTQQILAHESGVANTVDPLGGSYHVEALTDEMEEAARDYFEEIERIGGVLEGIKSGWFQQEIAEASYQYQQEVEERDRVVVGVNEFTEGNDEEPQEILKIDEESERHQKERLEEAKAQRDDKAAEAALHDLTDACERKSEGEDLNLMPYIMDAARAYCTIGEMREAMVEIYGEYQDLGVF
jgi:methylmalonyl-CoA mutase N-terminal domain/subunit